MKFLRSSLLTITALAMLGGIAGTAQAAAPLTSRVNEAYRTVYGTLPTPEANRYWLSRITSGEKTTYQAVLGAMYYQKANAAGASTTSGKVNSTNTTDTKQLIIDVLPLFVKIYGKDPSASDKAWWRKRISCNEIKSTDSLVASMTYHKSKGATKGADTICGQKGSGSSSGVGGAKVEGLSSHIMGDQVRIGIFSTDGSPILVTSNGKFQVREGNKILTTRGKDDVVEVSYSGGRYHIRGSGLNVDTEDAVRLVPLNQAIMQIKNYHDKSATIPGKDYNRFRGIIEIRRSDDNKLLWAINELRTEYYLRGLAETSGTGPEEYIKALGIAARTYVLYHKVVTGGRSVNGGWDILNTADDQIYRGFEYEIITPRMSSIFNQTRGVVATDNSSKLVTTVYFSDSDGRTRSAKEKWKTDRFPHLQHSVDDPHHASSSCRGHCVGMSAQGAFGFAKADNWSFSKILSYYYKGIKLVKAY